MPCATQRCGAGPASMNFNRCGGSHCQQQLSNILSGCKGGACGGGFDLSKVLDQIMSLLQGNPNQAGDLLQRLMAENPELGQQLVQAVGDAN